MIFIKEFYCKFPDHSSFDTDTFKFGRLLMTTLGYPGISVDILERPEY